MVHLPPDSRLLASLVKHEQAYSSQLYDLLNTSNASLSALVIYASSSPTEISNTLKNVANALSGADDAFRNYGEAVNNWIDQLRSIRKKEEEVVNMGRQRDVLVTRLIKVTQKSKATPQSLLHPASDSASTISFRSFNSKVSAAQMELQVCESHLAAQERELEAFRLGALKRGLQLRCQALVQCAWTWGELGRLCLSFLSDLNDIPTPNGTSSLERFRPLSTNVVYDHAPLSPSQSTSQVGNHFQDTQTSSPFSNAGPYSLKIPPPHRMPENGTVPVPSPITLQVQQQDQPNGDSSSESDVPVEVHENPQYKRKSVLDKARESIRKETASSPQQSPNLRAKTFNSDTNSLPSNSGQKDRKSHGLFGGLASLFKTSMSGKSSQQHGWDTRTKHNIRNARTDIEDSSDEERSRKLSTRRSKSAVRHSHLSSNSTLDSRGPTSLLASSSVSSPIGTHPSQQQRDRRESLTRTATIRSRDGESPNLRGGRERAATLSSSTATERPRIIGLSPNFPTSPTPPRMVFSDSARSLPRTGENGLPRIKEYTTPHDGLSSRSSSKAVSVPQAPPSILLSRLDSGFAATSTIPKSPSTDHVNFPVMASVSMTPRFEKKPLKSALRNTSKERDGSTSPLRTASISSGSSPAKLPPVVLPAPVSIHVPQASSPVRPLTPISPTPSDLHPPAPAALLKSPESGVTLSVGASIPANATVTPLSLEKRANSPRPSVSETSSISSYETGREDFYDNEGEDGNGSAGDHNDNHIDLSTLPVLLSPPQHEPISVQESLPQPEADAHEISSVTSGDTTIANGSENVTRRRKSVRLSSLPPEVLERTPTQEDYEDGGLFVTRKSHLRSSLSDTTTTATVTPAFKDGSGWKSRAAEDLSNVWEDSSSEDEGYKAARRALTRVKRHSSLGRK